MSSPAPTLQTIADLAGVSRMTVSRVLRNDRAISEATSRRVKEIAERLKYRPDPMVSAHMARLRSMHQVKNPQFIAFFTAAEKEHSWRKQFFFRQIFAAAEQKASQLGYGIAPVWIREPGMTGKRLDQILEAQGVRGIMIGTLKPLSHLRLDWSRYAIAALGYTLVRPAFHRVASNHFQTLFLVLRLLRRRGYRRIGLVITKKANLQTNHSVLGAFQAWQFQQPRSCQIKPCYLEGNARAKFDRWLQTAHPDVILTTELEVHSWTLENGMRIPQDLGFVLLSSDIEATDLAHIHRDYSSIGAALVDLIVSQLHCNERGIPAVAKVVSIDTAWKEGSSVRRSGVVSA